MNNPEGTQSDLLSEISELDFVRHLLAEMHDGLADNITRLRYLADLGGDLGTQGTLLFGGTATVGAWIEARSSFVHGNYIATILLCQALIENLLAAFLHAGLMIDNLPPRITFRDTLKRCRERHLITAGDSRDLERLANLRNPLSHFRPVDDSDDLDRRAIVTGLNSAALIEQDAWFAIGIASRVLAKPQFRLG